MFAESMRSADSLPPRSIGSLSRSCYLELGCVLATCIILADSGECDEGRKTWLSRLLECSRHTQNLLLGGVVQTIVQGRMNAPNQQKGCHRQNHCGPRSPRP